jgi:hypothetical protein
LLNFITLFVVDQAPSSGKSSIIADQIALKLADYAGAAHPPGSPTMWTWIWQPAPSSAHSRK